MYEHMYGADICTVSGIRLREEINTGYRKALLCTISGIRLGEEINTGHRKASLCTISGLWLREKRNHVRFRNTAWGKADYLRFSNTAGVMGEIVDQA